MIDEQRIKEVAERIGAAADAERVVLFGSYARGDASRHSDVDLMVIAESDLPRFKRSRELYQLFRPYPFGMDLVVYTPSEVEEGM
ncbi:MAG TPA: nucleotidyltransferase domain-containing protein, partial [Candidatus Hydrogenedentes bacterium]|nr:nucleotidyltransferase domain-containing protein [Candidatus Hydrogenedentota bacterium]